MPVPFRSPVSSLHAQKPEHEMSAPLLSSSHKVVPGGKTVNIYKRLHTFRDYVSVPFQNLTLANGINTLPRNISNLLP